MNADFLEFLMRERVRELQAEAEAESFRRLHRKQSTEARHTRTVFDARAALRTYLASVARRAAGMLTHLADTMEHRPDRA